MRGRTFGANQRYGGVDEVGGTEHNLSNIEISYGLCSLRGRLTKTNRMSIVTLPVQQTLAAW